MTFEIALLTSVIDTGGGGATRAHSLPQKTTEIYTSLTIFGPPPSDVVRPAASPNVLWTMSSPPLCRSSFDRISTRRAIFGTLPPSSTPVLPFIRHLPEAFWHSART